MSEFGELRKTAKELSENVQKLNLHLVKQNGKVGNLEKEQTEMKAGIIKDRDRQDAWKRDDYYPFKNSIERSIIQMERNIVDKISTSISSVKQETGKKHTRLLILVVVLASSAYGADKMLPMILRMFAGG